MNPQTSPVISPLPPKSPEPGTMPPQSEAPSAAQPAAQYIPQAMHLSFSQTQEILQGRKRWIKWFVLWLLALPLFVGLVFGLQRLLRQTPYFTSVTSETIDIAAKVLLIYAVVGWVPMAISYIINHKRII
jgi:hypothetical protein